MFFILFKEYLQVDFLMIKYKSKMIKKYVIKSYCLVNYKRKKELNEKDNKRK